MILKKFFFSVLYLTVFIWITSEDVQNNNLLIVSASALTL